MEREKTGVLSIRGLKKRGISDIYVTNRTDKKALDVAEKNDVTPVLFNNYKEELYKSDIIIAATNAGKYLIDKKDVEIANDLRNGKKQVFIDLSVPRNIDIEINEMPNANLYSVDDLQRILDKHRSLRMQSIEGAELIINELVEESMSWLNSRTLRPVIKAITTGMQELSKGEIAEYQKDMGDQVCEHLEKYAGFLTQKYIRLLIKKFERNHR